MRGGDGVLNGVLIWLLPGGAAQSQKTDDLHRDYLHESHGGKDHGIPDIGTLGRRHLGRIDKDRWISRRARCDANEVVVWNPQQKVAGQQDYQHGRQQNCDTDEQHREAGFRDGTDKGLSGVDADGGEEHRKAEIS